MDKVLVFNFSNHLIIFSNSALSIKSILHTSKSRASLNQAYHLMSFYHTFFSRSLFPSLPLSPSRSVSSSVLLVKRKGAYAKLSASI